MKRMSYQQYKRISGKERSKYKNRKVEFNGIKFDSIKERDRYIFLLSRLKKGEITNLELQVPFELQPHFEHNGKMIRAIRYIADFVYYDQDGNIHIEDTKGFRTDVYDLKKKMMLYRGFEIEEV